MIFSPDACARLNTVTFWVSLVLVQNYVPLSPAVWKRQWCSGALAKKYACCLHARHKLTREEDSTRPSKLYILYSLLYIVNRLPL